MDALFAIKSSYNKKMYYAQVLASKKIEPVVEKKKKFNLPEISFSDLSLATASFLIFFYVLPGADMATRLLQSLLTAGLFVLIMRKMNEKRQETIKQQTGSSDPDMEQAELIMESAGLSGEKYTVTFGEDTFCVEGPEIITEYRYEGIGWIKETADYYMIFWNRSLVIPVDKQGFTKGRPEQFSSFIEKKCGKRIEKVRK